MRNGIDIIKQFEGLRLTAYLCPAGKPTIGYGNTYYENGEKVKLNDTITIERAESLLKMVYDEFEKDILLYVTTKLNDNQLGALVSFVYNVGIGNFQKSTLLKKINANDFDGAAIEFLKWDKAAGKVLSGLTKRRKAESDLFKTPIKQNDNIKQESADDDVNRIVKLFNTLFGN